MSALAASPTRLWGRRDSLTPAFLAALALHLALLAAVLFLHGARPVPLGDVTPITLVADGPVTNSRPAEVAPREQAAQVEAPAPREEAPLPPPPPAAKAPAPPRPVKAPPVPEPAPTPKARTPPVKPPPAEPAPARPTPARAAPSNDTFLDSLSRSLTGVSKASPRPAKARQGPAQAETAPRPRVDAGQGVSQSDLQGLQQLLERLWNPNCAAPGADQLLIPVRFFIDAEGRVTGRIVEHGAADTAAARRAVDAVHQAEPYAAAYRNNTFTVNFDARKACSGREE